MSKKYRYKGHTLRKYLSDQSWTNPERIEELFSLINQEKKEDLGNLKPTNDSEINHQNPERR